ncbi:ubiquitin carboxyl-terminal hydrolase domain-containing protein [Ditylenchus destructor]|uniref:Ubiquitin carboxyl-terminal hydrolase n=1 Tax=Ditylenchus destructor TaxID=166010 RepID=A0AAD4N6P1_9BILA|nr:ubiquitin carboxyl-terminal hydrolase domain-containing protein [Ditylenchus destructor]
MSPERKSAKATLNETKARSMEIQIFPKGLSNLGNTCFFNSVMQCISHTHQLSFYFDRLDNDKHVSNSEKYKTQIGDNDVNVPLARISLPDMDMPLVSSFRNFVREYWSGREPNPRSLFDQISRKVPRFRGWQQQDAHELLRFSPVFRQIHCNNLFRYMLDGLRQEEILRFRKGFIRWVNEGELSNLTPEQTSLYKGALQQTIRCSKCDHVSTCFEPFLDLSLPLNYSYSADHHNGANYKRTKPEVKSKSQRKKEMKNKRKKGKKPHTTAKESVNDENTENHGTDENEKSPEFDEQEDEVPNHDLDEDESTPEPSSIAMDDAASTLAPLDNASFDPTSLSDKADNELAKRRTVDASKRYLVFVAPLNLTIHLKRFSQHTLYGGRTTTKKLRDFVEFGTKLDLAPFCCKDVQRAIFSQKSILYNLYGVVSHSGDMNSGHYVAYVRARPQMEEKIRFIFNLSSFQSPESLTPLVTEKCRGLSLDNGWTKNDTANDIIEFLALTSKWYYISDRSVQAVPESRVLNSEAFILFYERVS